MLDNNITYAFDKTHTVQELIDPQHTAVRKTLAEDDKLRGIIKTSDKPRPIKNQKPAEIVKTEVSQIVTAGPIPVDLNPICDAVIEDLFVLTF